jgi:hypothetical protein
LNKNIKEKKCKEMERLEIRKKIRADATNLCTYVVNTCCEYKEEIIELEKDNGILLKKNKYLKNLNKNLEEQNEILVAELENAQKRVNKLIEKLGKNNLCHNCDHFLDCNIASLCVYCQKWVCMCCSKDCDNLDCTILLCTNCSSSHPLCPKHDETISNKDDLLNFYRENKFKNIVL